MLIKIDAAPAAFFYKPFGFTENARDDKIDQKPWHKKLHHGFRENKVTTVIVEIPRLQVFPKFRLLYH